MDGIVLVRLSSVIQMVIQTVKYVEGKMQLYIYGAALASALHFVKTFLCLKLVIMAQK